MPKSKTKPAYQLPDGYVYNDDLPNPWIDNFSVTTRSDGISIISFFSLLPSGNIEKSRIITHKEKLKSFIEASCKNLDYYPVKEKIEEEEKKH